MKVTKKFDIVYISNISWDYSWHREQEMMSWFAKNGHRIIFVEETKSKLSKQYELKKINENITVLEIRGFKFERCLSLINYINSYKTNKILNKVMDDMNFVNPVIWFDRVHGINTDYYLDNYYCVYDLIDELTAFGRWKNINLLNKLERNVLKKCDFVLSSSNTLSLRKSEFTGGKDILFCPNGLEFERFNYVKKDFNKLKVIGFIGTISDRRINFKLLNELAKEHPEKEFVLIGPKEYSGQYELEPNVILKDAVNKDEVPHVINTFDIGIIPYNINKNDMDYIFPRKVFEYLASGLPVVSVDMKELQFLNEYIYVIDNALDFSNAINQIKKETNDNTQMRINIAKKYDWDHLLRNVSKIISENIK